MPEGLPKALKPDGTCPFKVLSGMSGLMNPMTRPGEDHESRLPLYARGLSRGQFNPSPGSDRGLADSSPAVLKRALPWEAISEAMTRHWRAHGKNVDG